MSLVWTPEVLQRGQNNIGMKPITKLSNVAKGKYFKIVEYVNMSNEVLRMAEMGFTPNTLIKVILNDGKNPLILKTRNVKLMIARNLAETIYVVE